MLRTILMSRGCRYFIFSNSSKQGNGISLEQSNPVSTSTMRFFYGSKSGNVAFLYLQSNIVATVTSDLSNSSTILICRHFRALNSADLHYDVLKHTSQQI